MNEVLEQLAELYAKRDLLTIDKSKAMPDEIKKIVAEIDEEYQPKFDEVNKQIETLEAKVKESVIACGETVKGFGLQAVFTKGRVTWDSKVLDGLMIAVPELKQARKEGQPSVSIRRAA